MVLLSFSVINEELKLRTSLFLFFMLLEEHILCVYIYIYKYTVYIYPEIFTILLTSEC